MATSESLDGGRLLALADDYRRGLHEASPNPGCSQCVVIPLLEPDDPRLTGEAAEPAV